jgi:acyl-CoA thioester hydrolase
VSVPVLVWPVRVYYEDTDASGVVYHAAYLRFFERARTEWLRALGYSQERLRVEAGAAFTVAGMELEFRRPARLDDALEATAEVELLRRASMIFVQTLRYAVEPGTVLAQARVRVACVDAASFKPRALPEFLAGGDQQQERQSLA